jgi:hypothetical protein
MGKTIGLPSLERYARKASVYNDTPSYYEEHIRILKKDVNFWLSTNEMLTIKAGFEWDEVSVPYLLQWAFPKSGKYAYSALVHDALYYSVHHSQKFADDEFRKWMYATGNISKRQIYLRWLFVRMFGGIYWKKNVNKPSARCLHNRKLVEII